MVNASLLVFPNNLRGIWVVCPKKADLLSQWDELDNLFDSFEEYYNNFFPDFPDLSDMPNLGALQTPTRANAMMLERMGMAYMSQLIHFVNFLLLDTGWKAIQHRYA